MRAYAYAAALCAALAAIWYAYAQGKDAGRSECEARIAAATESARTAERDRDAIAAQAGIDMLDYLSRMQETRETTTHETIERIRTVYRDRPVPAECVWPVGVQSELDKAIHRANTAAR